MLKAKVLGPFALHSTRISWESLQVPGGGLEMRFRVLGVPDARLGRERLGPGPGRWVPGCRSGFWRGGFPFRTPCFYSLRRPLGIARGGATALFTVAPPRCRVCGPCGVTPPRRWTGHVLVGCLAPRQVMPVPWEVSRQAVGLQPADGWGRNLVSGARSPRGC